MSELVKYYLEANSFQLLYPIDFLFLFLKLSLSLSLSLSRYQSDRFGYRVNVIEVADLEKRLSNYRYRSRGQVTSAYRCYYV